MMDMVNESVWQTPVIIQAGVLVIGSDLAGLSATITAGRLDARTMVVERYGSLGGVLTRVGVESFTWYRHSGTKDCEEICRGYEGRARALGFTRPEPQSISEIMDTEGFKVVTNQMITESDAESLYHSWVVDAIKGGDTLCGVIVENKSGRGAILTKRIADCTEDANIIARAETPWTERSKGQLMSAIVISSCVGIDVARLNRFVTEELRPTYADWGKNQTTQATSKEDPMFNPYMEDIFTRTRQGGMILGSAQAIAGTWSTFSEGGEVFQMNMVYVFGFDCTGVFDLAKAEIVRRQQALWAADTLCHYVPDFEDVRLRNFGAAPGTHESWLVEGEMCTVDDHVLNQGRCPDSVGISPEFTDGPGCLTLSAAGCFFQIPYGRLVPQKVENLLVTGRCIPTGIVARASICNMMCCAVIGEAAGTVIVVSLQ